MTSAGDAGGHQRQPANLNLNDMGAADGAALDHAQLVHPVKEKFDPSKFISEDFLQILNEHRKNCEREGKLEQAT